MATTIQVTQELRSELAQHKLSESETYEEVIWDLLEDVMELSEETKSILRASEADVKKGRIHTLSEVKRELNV